MTLLQISNDLMFQIVEEIKKQQLDILKQLEEIQENEFIMNNIELSKINLKYLENKLLAYKILGSLMRND